ncbi:MAG: 50S ribosomal protein L3 N(5)-glutamine methyltransferase [Gammaproteobacteria bacterium]|nr:50S ribosomal protein L3 N(5)-glutamine methyltransferase [Gammaproteobacteria bacterium]
MSTSLLQAIETTEAALIEAQVHFGHGTDNAWDEAVFLVLGACGMPLDAQEKELKNKLTQSQLNQVQTWLTKRIQQRIPLPYLLGETWFAGIPFRISRNVIIPRSPMAELISGHFSPFVKQPPMSALDLCCGSGCMGIAMALHMDIPHVDMVDIASDALTLSQENIDRHNLNDQVQVVKSNLFAGLDPKSYDLIVSNPPYVDANDYSQMPAEFSHEPKLALVSGRDGLNLTAAMLSQAANWLSEQSLIVIEVGNSEVALQEALPEVPFMWLDLSHGGNGIFCLTGAQCRQYQARFRAWHNSR